MCGVRVPQSQSLFAEEVEECLERLWVKFQRLCRTALVSSLTGGGLEVKACYGVQFEVPLIVDESKISGHGFDFTMRAIAHLGCLVGEYKLAGMERQMMAHQTRPPPLKSRGYESTCPQTGPLIIRTNVGSGVVPKWAPEGPTLGPNRTKMGPTLS